MRSLGYAVLLVLALAAAPARATEVQHLDTAQLTRSSSDILVGKVQGVQSRWNTAHTKIFTDITVRVTDALKGANAPTVSFTQLGGTVGDLRYEVEGCPAFRNGEEALLFLWRDGHGVAQLNGLGQGKFEITRDAQGRRMVQRGATGLAVQEARRLSMVPTGHPVPPIPLDDLLAEIRANLAEGGR
jgi:hypothetical protein